MTQYEVAELMASSDLKPFWDEVERIRRAEMEQLFKLEDPSYIKSVKALDRVLRIPQTMRS